MQTAESWTLELMIERLAEIRGYLGGRIPSYSEIYDDRELRARFNSCSLAGAIFRYNNKHEIRSYREFVKRFLDWDTSGKLTKARTQEVFERLLADLGGIPMNLGTIHDIFGHKGHAFEEAFKAHYGVSVKEYCKEHGIARLCRSKCGLE